MYIEILFAKVFIKTQKKHTPQAYYGLNGYLESI